jgi:hypothetical protein
MNTATIRIAAITLAASLALGACNQEPETINAGPADPQANTLASAPPVTLPPAIKSAKTYRCKDNSLVYISFMTDDVTAMVRDKQEEPPVATLKAKAPGEPFEGQGPEGKGFKLSGSGPSVTYTSPDSGTLTCKG